MPSIDAKITRQHSIPEVQLKCRLKQQQNLTLCHHDEPNSFDSFLSLDSEFRLICNQPFRGDSVGVGRKQVDHRRIAGKNNECCSCFNQDPMMKGMSVFCAMSPCRSPFRRFPSELSPGLRGSLPTKGAIGMPPTYTAALSNTKDFKSTSCPVAQTTI